MASHRTIGIENGAQAIHLAVCLFDGERVTLERQTSARLPESEEERAEVLQHLSDWVYENKSQSIDAIGQAVESTSALMAHKVFAFNDPRVIDKVLEMTMAETWTITDDTQLSFEVGEPVKAQAEGESDGYDVTVLNYSREKLRQSIDLFKPYRLEPHVMIPELQAMPYAVSSFFDFPADPVAVLDIGANKATLLIIEDGVIKISRALKLGSHRIDEAITQSFEMSLDDAELLKCSSGFVAMPGEEMAVYKQLVDAGQIVPLDNPTQITTLANACLNGISMLFTAVNQTLMRYAMTSRKDPVAIYLTGNGARLAGLEAWMSRQMGVTCTRELPARTPEATLDPDFSIVALSAAVAALKNIDGACPLNLRRGELAHKGSLEYLKDNKWILASLVVILIISAIFMMSTRVKTVNAEHDQLKAALEQASQDVFGKKMTSYNAIKKEIESSKGYNFLPQKTAFEHFEWLSNEITNNMTGIDLELSQLDIDTQRKIVTLRGEVAGDDGLPKFMQLLEQYECFPDEIAEPKTSKVKERTAFTLRVEANHCATGGDDSE